ncbi:hypothetical protein CR513_35424, partial [Mucuna pruriens]
MNNNNLTTSSPNNSESSEPRDDVMGGIMAMNEHDLMTMCMDSSSSTSSSSMHAMVLTDQQFDPFPLLSNRYDMTGAAGFLDNMAACLTQVGMVDHDGVHGGYGTMLEPNKTGLLESDFSLPPLESTSINEDNSSTPIDVKTHNNHFKNTCFNNTDHHHIQSSNNVGVEDLFGFGNHGQGENFRMGEWDFEDLACKKM